MPKKETALVKTASPAALAALREEYPTEATFNRVLLPRLAFTSQDVMEGAGKNKKVVIEAGTFALEKPEKDENDDMVKDEEGKVQWERDEIGSDLEAIILFQRKQLKYFDEATELYTSSPVYDNDDETLPLFCDKKEVGRGTVKELKAKYEYTNEEGKVRSKLEDTRILYVLIKGEVYQLNLRGTSMFAFFQYARTVTPNTVLTAFNSEAKNKGKIDWNQMTFAKVRDISADEADTVLEKIQDIKKGIADEKGFYAAKNEADEEDEEDEDEDDGKGARPGERGRGKGKVF